MLLGELERRILGKPGNRRPALRDWVIMAVQGFPRVRANTSPDPSGLFAAPIMYEFESLLGSRARRERGMPVSRLRLARTTVQPSEMRRLSPTACDR